MAWTVLYFQYDFSFGVPEVAAAGVYQLAEAEVYVPGAAEAEVYVPGAAEAEVQP